MNKKDKEVKEVKVRNSWIPQFWRMSGCGLHKNKKKEIFRKQKYRNKED